MSSDGSALRLTGAPRAELGDAMAAFVREAYPICRSITGDGVRSTFDLLDDFLKHSTSSEPLRLERSEVETGTPVLDWQVPKEWNLTRATLTSPRGQVIVDTEDSNLHLLNYSTPYEGSVTLEELDPHLYSLPEQPSLVPYRTSYYQERWGFCLAHEQRAALEKGSYRVSIDTSLENGALTYGELSIEGTSDKEILISAHCCHPSLCNDNLSGMIVAAALAQRLATTNTARYYSYRVLFAPGTIGAITWLARNEKRTPKIAHGLIAANLGYSHPGDNTGVDPTGGAGNPLFHYKRSRRGATIDLAVEAALEELALSHSAEDFIPFGYDERQYCSPGFDLPVGLLSRTPWGQYPQYHTSADDLSLLDPDVLLESLDLYSKVVEVLESWSEGAAPAAVSTLRRAASEDGTRVLVNQSPKGEPQLGSRGLYNTLGGGEEGREQQLALLWVLNLSDGRHSLGDIAQRSGIGLARIEEAADQLQAAALLA